MPAKELMEFLKKHKGKLLVLIAVLFILAIGYLSIFFFAPMAEIEMYTELGRPGHFPIEPTVEVKEGSITIKSINAEAESDKIRSYVKDYGGYVENFQKYDTYAEVRIVIKARIPYERFDELFEKIKSEFKIEKSNLYFYKLTVGEELTELDILNVTMKDLESIRAQINALPLGKEKIELLMELTEKQLTIRSKIRDYSARLQTKEVLGRLSRLSITLEQEKPIAIVPENLGRQFNEKLRGMVQSIAIIFMDIVTGILPLMFTVVKYLIFALIVILPFIAFFVFLKSFYKKIEEKIKV